MKYKKEFRWLAFLLVPFIALLSLYVFVPLLIAGNSYSVLQNAYNFQTTVTVKSTVRSLHMQNQQILQAFLG